MPPYGSFRTTFFFSFPHIGQYALGKYVSFFFL